MNIFLSIIHFLTNFERHLAFVFPASPHNLTSFVFRLSFYCSFTTRLLLLLDFRLFFFFEWDQAWVIIWMIVIAMFWQSARCSQNNVGDMSLECANTKGPCPMNDCNIQSWKHYSFQTRCLKLFSNHSSFCAQLETKEASDYCLRSHDQFLLRNSKEWRWMRVWIMIQLKYSQSNNWAMT